MRWIRRQNDKLTVMMNKLATGDNGMNRQF